jgi:hypothetical protein
LCFFPAFPTGGCRPDKFSPEILFLVLCSAKFTSLIAGDVNIKDDGISWLAGYSWLAG